MRKSIILIATFIITMVSYAQVTETNTSSVPTTVGSFNASLGSQAILTQQIKGIDTTYALTFKNYLDKNSHRIDFREQGDALNSLYKILISFFYPENKKNQDYKRTFRLGKEDITCTSFRSNSTSVVFTTNIGFFVINEKQCGKLFGK